jgi:hypothetical protein
MRYLFLVLLLMAGCMTRRQALKEIILANEETLDAKRQAELYKGYYMECLGISQADIKK